MLWAGLLLTGAGLGAGESAVLTWVTPESLAGCQAALGRRERDQEADLGGEVVAVPGSWDEASDATSLWGIYNLP